MTVKRIAIAASVAALAALPLAGAAHAADNQPTAEQPVAPKVSTQSVLDCNTGVAGLDGSAACRNNTDQPVSFAVQVVCGWAPDVTGNWVTLNPGATGTSTGTCPSYSSGAGSASWIEQ
nr:hypothetical protein [Streptomyces sp. GESEQ-35]